MHGRQNMHTTAVLGCTKAWNSGTFQKSNLEAYKANLEAYGAVLEAYDAVLGGLRCRSGGFLPDVSIAFGRVLVRVGNP